MVFISDRELADYEEETVLASQAMDMGISQEELLGKHRPHRAFDDWRDVVGPSNQGSDAGVSTIDGRGRCVRMHR